MRIDFMQAAVEEKLLKMLDSGIAIEDIVCLVPVEELAGPMTTRLGIIHALYSKYIPCEMTFYLIRRTHFKPRQFKFPI